MADREMWKDLVTGDDPLGEAGALARLRKTSQAGLIKCYGRWLEWLYRTEPAVLEWSPSDRMTVTRLRAWISDLAAVTPPTRHTLAYGALRVLRAAYPATDWRHTLLPLKRLLREARSWKSDRKDGRIVSGAVVLAAAQRLSAPEAEPTNTELNTALLRRDATIMAFLTIMPIRLRALSELTLGQSVIVTPASITIVLSGDMTKNRSPWESIVPEPLAGMIRVYLAETRSWLMARTNARHDALWVTRLGTPLAYARLKNLLGEVTNRALGINISPHLFRDIAVTTLVRSSPQDALLTRPLLGHSSYGIVERHYNQARGIEAGQDYVSVINRLKQEG